MIFITLGIVKKDPKLPENVVEPPPQRSTDSVFDQEDKAKVGVGVLILFVCTSFV